MTFGAMGKYLDNMSGAAFGKPGFGQNMVPPELIKQSFVD